MVNIDLNLLFTFVFALIISWIIKGIIAVIIGIFSSKDSFPGEIREVSMEEFEEIMKSKKSFQERVDEKMEGENSK